MLSRNRAVVAGAGAVVIPVVILSVYLYASRLAFASVAPGYDYLFLALAVGLGVTCVAMVPARPSMRLTLVVGYLPVATFLLFVFTFWFIGSFFGEWL